MTEAQQVLRTHLLSRASLCLDHLVPRDISEYDPNAITHVNKALVDTVVYLLGVVDDLQEQVDKWRREGG